MENSLLNKRKSKFGLQESAFATFLFVLYNVLFVQIYVSFIPRAARANQLVVFLASFLIEALFAFSAWSTALVKKVEIVKASGMNKKFNAKIVLYGLLIAIVSIVGFGNITNVFLEFLTMCGYKSQLSSEGISHFWQYLIYIVVFCATPAFCEELLFRGTILSGLKQYGIKTALIVSALIFTVMHGNAEQTVHQFIIGILVGYLFFKTGNLWLGVIVHFFNNFISVTATYFTTILSDGKAAVVNESSLNPWVQLVYSALFAIAFAYFGFQVLKFLIKRIIDEDEKLNSSIKTSTTISVDGEEIETKMEIDGLVQNEGVESELAENAKEEPKEQLSVATIVFFTLACSYLAIEWVGSLLIGLGVI